MFRKRIESGGKRHHLAVPGPERLGRVAVNLNGEGTAGLQGVREKFEIYLVVIC